MIAPQTGLKPFAHVHAEQRRGNEPLRGDLKDVEGDFRAGGVKRFLGRGCQRVGLQMHDGDAVNGDDALQ